MERYLRRFNKHSEYEAFTGTSEFIVPNVSYCLNENDVHYNQMFASEIAFINPTTTVKVGNSVTNPVTVREGDGAITYSSSDTTKATVDANGVVSGISTGEVTITATISETDFYLSAETSYSLEVEKGASDIEFIDPTTNMAINSSLTNQVTVNAGDGVITYSSSDEAIATVDANGKVSGVTLGNVTITATISETDNYLSAETSYELTVETPKLCKLTLKNGSTVEIEGSGELTSAMTKAYSATCVSAEITNYCTSIGAYVFRDCTGLTEITIPDSVTSIGKYGFSHCSGLTSLTIGNSVTSIEKEVFAGCSGLTEVTIPDSVTTIGQGVFFKCYSLSSVTIGNSLTSLGGSAFRFCSGLTEVTIPNSVTIIDAGAFSECISLSSVTIPDSVTSIENNAFYQCYALTSVTIPDSVTEIGSAFYQCTSLSSVTIGSGVTEITNQAFYQCTSLDSIISNAIAAPTIAYNTFSNVKSGGTLYVPSGSSGYDVWMGTGDNYLGKYNWNKVEQ